MVAVLKTMIDHPNGFAGLEIIVQGIGGGTG